MNDTYAETEFR